MLLEDLKHSRIRDLPDELRETVVKMIFKYRDGAFDELKAAEERLGRYVFLCNGGGAVAILGYLGTVKPTDKPWPFIFALMAFSIGLIAVGAALWASQSIWCQLHSNFSALLGAGEKTVEEALEIQPKTVWTKIEPVAIKIAIIAFAVGVVAGLSWPFLSP